MKKTYRVLFILYPLPLVLALPGCGLSDYEGKMASEAKRARYWDEETKLLGEPIALPTLPKKKDEKGKDIEQTWPEVFLRLPRGVSDIPKAQQNGSLTEFVHNGLAQYGGGANNVGIQNVYLGVVVSPKDYASKILTEFGAGSGGEADVKIQRSPVLLSGTGRALPSEITVKRKTFEGQSFYSLNFYDYGKVSVAIVFEMERGNGTRADAAIQASLATLGVEDEVYSMRKAYEKSNRKVPRK